MCKSDMHTTQSFEEFCGSELRDLVFIYLMAACLSENMMTPVLVSIFGPFDHSVLNILTSLLRIFFQTEQFREYKLG